MRFKVLALASASVFVLAAATPAWAQDNRAGASNNAPATGAQASDPGVPDAAAPAAADTAEDGGTQNDIVVTGFRESLRSAQNLKRNAPQIVDAVVAEDIGKLPDLAVSDTAARIPGVQVLRLGGEASQVLIRGLPEQFFNTLYNGREIFTAERRQVSLQDFPSAGIAALEVFKTSTANQVEPGVIGLTNVRSRRPFDIKGFEVAGNLWGLHTAEAGSVTPNGNILISNRWQTGAGEIGLLLNASYTELRYLDSEPSNTDFLATTTANGASLRFPDVQRLFYRSGNRTRPSGNAALQWRPSDKLEFYVEGLYQGFRNSVDDTLAAVPLYGATYSDLVFRPGANLVSSGVATNPGGRIFSFRGGTRNKTDTYQVAAGGIYDSGPLRVTADVARTTSTFTGSTESVDREFAINGYTAIFDNETPQFSITNFNAADPAQYRFLGLFEEAQKSRGKDWQARVDAEYRFDTSFLRSFQLGGRYTTRDARRRFGSRYFGGQDIPITALPINFKPVRPGFGTTDIQGFRTFLAPTFQSIRANIVPLRQFVIARGATGYTTADVLPDAFSSYDADEKTYAGYAQLNYNFNDVVDGTVGLRVVRSETRVNGSALLNGAVTPVTAGPDDTAYLPNASIRVRATPEIQFRGSFTQTQTRPDFSQLNPAINVGSPQIISGGATIRFGGGGNPNLKPYKSNNYDLTAEWYFSRTGFISVAGFRRDVTDFIQTRADRFTDPLFGLVEISRPVNLSKVNIDGAEAQLSTFFDFDFVPDFFRSFGLQANYTYVDTDPRLNGVSKHGYNVVGLFERGPVSARLTYNGRTRFLDFTQDRGDDIFNQYGDPSDRLDLSTNLRFTPNTTLFFDATNLTGNPTTYYFNSARAGAPRAEYVRFLRFEERTFSAGLRFRF